jgi:hypothetical protein
MQKLFESWRKYVLNEQKVWKFENPGEGARVRHGSEGGEKEKWTPFEHPDFDIEKERRLWKDAYTKGVSRRAFIGFLKRVLPARSPEKLNHAYEKHFLPRIINTIEKTDVINPIGKYTARSGAAYYSNPGVIVMDSRHHGMKRPPGPISKTVSKYDLARYRLHVAVADTFAHELAHAMDATFRKDSRLFKKIYKKLGRDMPSQKDHPTALSTAQINLLRCAFPDLETHRAGEGLHGHDAREDYYKRHSYKSWELYASIIGFRTKLGREFTPRDIKWMRPEAKSVLFPRGGFPEKIARIFFQDKEKFDVDERRLFISLAAGQGGFVDLRNAFDRPANQGISNEKIANCFNQLASNEMKKPSYMQQFKLAESKIRILIK